MSLAFYAAPIDDCENNVNKKERIKKRRNSTLKHRTDTKQFVRNKIDDIHGRLAQVSEPSQTLTDYKPVTNSEINYNNEDEYISHELGKRPTTPTLATMRREGEPGNTFGGPPPASSFSNMENSEPEIYLEEVHNYPPNITKSPSMIHSNPSFNLPTHSLYQAPARKNTNTAQPNVSNLNFDNISGDKQELLRKLNYMIQLLEEQQDERTGHVTEEVILYSFLGIFIIFVVDSFARAGKYIR